MTGVFDSALFMERDRLVQRLQDIGHGISAADLREAESSSLAYAIADHIEQLAVPADEEIPALAAELRFWADRYDDRRIPARRSPPGAVRRLRIQRGWPLRETARRFGVDPSAVSRWENGSRKPPPLIRVMRAFGVTEAEVLAVCPHCRCQPPAGYMCLTCGYAG